MQYFSRHFSRTSIISKENGQSSFHVKFQFLKTREAVIELNFKSKALQRRVICRKPNKITMSQALSNQDDCTFDGCSAGSLYYWSHFTHL